KMAIPPGRQHWSSVNEVVEAYESVVARGDRAEIADFAPPPDHPERLAILCELVRGDPEHRWERGQPRPLGDSRPPCPPPLPDPAHVQAMVHEEYRLRLQAGEAPAAAAEYRRRFGIKIDDGPAPQAEPCADEDEVEEAEMALAASAYRAYKSHGPGDPEE